MSTQPPSINFEPVKKWLVYIISILALIVSVVTAINSALPNQIGEPPIVVTNQGVTNLDDLTLSGALTADTVTADTVTATTLVSQSVEFAGTNATLTNLISTAGLAASGNVTITGDTHAGTVYVDGYLRSAVGPVTSFDAFTALKEFTATKGIIINGTTFTMTSPITISGVISNVRLLYYQVP